MKKNIISKIILLSTIVTLTTGATGIYAKADVANQERHIIENMATTNNNQVTKAGYVKDYYELDGDLYIIFDEVEFFRNEQAREEYFKDGNTEEPIEEWGNDYYIRNDDFTIKKYKVSKDAKFELPELDVNKGNTIDLVPVTADTIKEKLDIENRYCYPSRGLLFNIDDKDGVVVGMRKIYVP